MTTEDIRFYGALALGFGAPFVLGGRLLAFSYGSVAFIFVGTAMLFVAPFLLRSLRAAVLSLVLLVVSWWLPLSVFV